MRKAAARGSGANKSAVRIGLVVVCVGLGREFEARLGTGSLVWGQEGRTPAGSGEAHQGGSWNCGFMRRIRFNAHRDGVDERERFRVLREHRREHTWDDVTKSSDALISGLKLPAIVFG